MEFFKRNKKIIIGSTIALTLGLLLGYLLFYRPHLFSADSGDNCNGYPFINKTLDCGSISENISHIQDIDLRVRKIIDEETRNNNITRASIFYRDLNTRRWFGINDTEDFYAASLLKLPIAIIYFKLAEIEPDILNQKFPLSKESRNAPEFFPSDKKLLVPGETYSIRELIKGMLRDSDNNPVPILNEHTDPILRSSILHDLGIEQSSGDPSTPDRYVNVRIYSNILRFLYNASFLNLEYSNTLLEYLSQTSFDKGIVAAIPQDIRVAHKFGEATKTNPDGSVESRILHDCGIVYHPTDPYIICIMTEGEDYSKMSETIQRITKATFEM